MSFELNPTAGQSLKQAGQQLALDYSGYWQDFVIDEFRDWLRVQKARGLKDITIEEFRAQAKSQPLSANAWGSLPRIAAKAGLIRRELNSDGDPVYRKAAAPRTHAHPVGVYKILVAA